MKTRGATDIPHYVTLIYRLLIYLINDKVILIIRDNQFTQRDCIQCNVSEILSLTAVLHCRALRDRVREGYSRRNSNVSNGLMAIDCGREALLHWLTGYRSESRKSSLK